MNSDQMFTMYQTAYKLLEYRENIHKQAGIIEFNENIKNTSDLRTYLQKNDKRVIIKAKTLQIIIFEPDSLAMRSNGLQKLFNQFIDRHTIFILPKYQDFNSIITYLNKLRGPNKPDISTMELFEAGNASKYRIEMNIYNVLMFNMPTHVTFTTYELISKEEAELWTKTMERSLSLLPKISVYDTYLFWHGFKEYDLVIEHKLSPTSGVVFILKVVTNPYNSKGARTKKFKAT